MKIDIEIENPNERELELISELSKIEYEKMMEERRRMEDAYTLLTKMPNMFRDLSKKENSIGNMGEEPDKIHMTADINRLIQENSALRAELSKALQRIADFK